MNLLRNILTLIRNRHVVLNNLLQRNDPRRILCGHAKHGLWFQSKRLSTKRNKTTLNIQPTKTTQQKIKYTKEGLKAFKNQTIQQVRLYISQIFQSHCNDTKYALTPPICNAKELQYLLGPSLISLLLNI